MPLNLLSKEELDAYRRDGFVIPRFKFSDADTDKLQRLTQQLVAQNPQVRGGIRRPHLTDGSCPHSAETSSAWLDIARNPDLLEIIEDLIGPDIVLWTSTLFYKTPLEPSTPWHRDGRYYPIKPLATITAWIAVFDVVRESAALRMVPGSQISRPICDAGEGGLHLSEAEESAAVDVELDAGQMVVFDVSTIHSSWPNLSYSGRAGYAVRYFPSTSFYDRSCAPGLASRELILVRGQDRAGNKFRPCVDA